MDAETMAYLMEDQTCKRRADLSVTCGSLIHSCIPSPPPAHTCCKLCIKLPSDEEETPSPAQLTAA